MHGARQAQPCCGLGRKCESQIHRMKRENLLLVADSERNADMLYAVGFFVPDPCIFLQQGKRSTVVLSDLEIDRGRNEAQVDEVVALSEISKRIPKGKDASFAGQVAAFLRSRKVRRISP